MNKLLSQRINEALDNIDVPPHYEERIQIFAKLTHLPRFKAEALLNGETHLNPSLLEVLTRGLDVTQDWLLGKNH